MGFPEETEHAGKRDIGMPERVSEQTGAGRRFDLGFEPVYGGDDLRLAPVDPLLRHVVVEQFLVDQ